MGRNILKRITSLLITFIIVAGYFFCGKSYVPKIEMVKGSELNELQKSEILSVEQGFYSSKIFIFAKNIEVLEYSEERIIYRVEYFPFGSIERSYSKDNDGIWYFNLEKPLTGL